jgi:cysteinyl-tRNA synthetase
MTRQKDEFIPLKKNRAGIYTCGPTVYNYAHIGNLRTYLFEDLLVKTLNAAGYKTKHVMNITDVGHLSDDGDEGEDKIIKSAREKGMTLWDIGQFFTNAFFRDTDRLNIKKPDISCKATEHIQDMIDLVKILEKKGYTYISDGNVYFDISKFPKYGHLARLSMDDLQAGARIDIDSAKKNPHDFVVWFTNSKFKNQAMQWDSPWGTGFPGWHLECSAMSMKYLGKTFDIHCGGIDHIPVHHTNEIAQSQASTGKKWVNYWIHGEFLVMNKGKMSKSKNNFITLSTLIDQGYNPLSYRYLCLTAHYRSQLTFSINALDTADKSLKSLKKKIKGLAKKCRAMPIADKEGNYYKLFLKFLCDDLNSPRAIAQIYETITLSGSQKITPEQSLAQILAMDEITSLNLFETAKEAFDSVNEHENSSNPVIPKEIGKLLDKRQEARTNKDFTESDLIRDKLNSMGWKIIDTPEGQKIEAL